MSVTLQIPDEIVRSLGAGDAQDPTAATRLELALSLYGTGRLTMGQAARLAGTSSVDFGDLVGARGVPRQYDAEDLDTDLLYVRHRRHLRHQSSREDR